MFLDLTIIKDSSMQENIIKWYQDFVEGFLNLVIVPS